MNKIPIILIVYKRPDFFQKQLETIVNQSCVSDIELHIISNNPSINFNELTKPYINDIEISFVQRKNKLQPFERHYYCYNNMSNFEHIILIDDDMFLSEDSIENMWNQKETNTLKGHWLRKFNFNDFIENKNPYTSAPIVRDKNLLYNYVGTGLCIFDISIYSYVIPLFEKYRDFFYKNYNIKIERMDDLFISWVANMHKYKIKYSEVTPLEHYGHDDDVALAKEDMGKKDFLTKELHKIYPWKNYER